jgi:hypothetical protein
MLLQHTLIRVGHAARNNGARREFKHAQKTRYKGYLGGLDVDGYDDYEYSYTDTYKLA